MARASRASAPRTVVLSGPTGVGTTALAVTLAKQLTRDFPGGQFFVNLRANSDRPLHPGAAMGMLLGALGVPRDGIPTELEARARLYRSLLHGRRALIVLDNAVSEAQVQPLLPVSSTCLVMITSRQPLTGLTAVQRLQVEPLAEHEAMAVLGRAVGPHRATAQQEQLRHLARLCGRLPLALRLVGGMLAAHPQLPAVELSKRLLEVGRRIAPTVRGSVQVHAALAVAYRLLRPAAQLALRRLALSPESRYCAEMTSVLTEGTSTEATALLNELAVSGLITPIGDSENYTCHEVVRAFAEDRLREESDPVARFAAENRLLDWLIHTAISISSVYEQPKPTTVSGRFAARELRPSPEEQVSGPDLASVPQEGHALRLLRQALVLARRLGDKRKEGYVLLYLGTANERLQRHQEGVDHYLRSAAVFREIGSRMGEAAALGNIAHAAAPAQRYASS
ncbi:NB-ARC domain-containing protein [Crossiella sp. NPDC003009]